jgi:hypothetical protein
MWQQLQAEVAGKFFETTGTGQLMKEVTANLTNYVMPVGVGANYFPASITTVGTYASALVGVQGKNGADPHKTYPQYRLPEPLLAYNPDGYYRHVGMHQVITTHLLPGLKLI